VKSNELRAIRRLFEVVKVSRLKVRDSILESGKKKKERRKRRGNPKQNTRDWRR
jgi:hypothetical protein